MSVLALLFAGENICQMRAIWFRCLCHGVSSEAASEVGAGRKESNGGMKDWR